MCNMKCFACDGVPFQGGRKKAALPAGYLYQQEDVLKHESVFAFQQGSIYRIRDGMYATKRILKTGDTFYKSLDEAKAVLMGGAAQQNQSVDEGRRGRGFSRPEGVPLRTRRGWTQPGL